MTRFLGVGQITLGSSFIRTGGLFDVYGQLSLLSGGGLEGGQLRVAKWDQLGHVHVSRGAVERHGGSKYKRGEVEKQRSGRWEIGNGRANKRL
jgi:hypothetical protein